MSSSFLVFSLAAPMASFGDVAGHERRGSRERPGKSALLGLLGAALGLHRDDNEGQAALQTGYEFAVLVVNPGMPLQDFHTVQSVAANKNLHPRTRADALARGKRKTTITRRDYRLDVHYHIALSALSGAQWSLDDLAKALKHPHFTLYLGRKSCPPSLPLDPRIVEAVDIVQAVQTPDLRDKAARRQKLLHTAVTAIESPAYVALTAERYAQLREKPNGPPRIETFNDEPIDRQKWHFTARREVVLQLDKQGGKTDNQEVGK